MMEMNNYYWSAGYIDGAGNFDPAGYREWSADQLKLFWAGYRCGVRDRANGLGARDLSIHQDDRALRLG